MNVGGWSITIKIKKLRPPAIVGHAKREAAWLEETRLLEKEIQRLMGLLK
tara:strand:- start:462 stop:611 length:150 start_codon:yes stop_codon:yes gene_type:complete